MAHTVRTDVRASARQPPIGDYAILGNGRSVALVSRSGSIDWCCMGRVDRESCFGRLIDWERGGFFQIAPEEEHDVTRRYLGGTMVLETTFRTRSGAVRLLDFVAGRRRDDAEREQLVRIVEGVEGSVTLVVDVQPRFGYGLVPPWVRPHADGTWSAIGGDLGLLFHGDVPLERVDDHDLGARVTVERGRRARIAVCSFAAHELYPKEPPRGAREDLDRYLEETIDWWRGWSSRCALDLEHAKRSAAVIRVLAHEPTGAIAAAPTTSLPERIGGDQNWDYRYSWVRDSSMAVRAMAALGYADVAEGFRWFVERTTAGSAEVVQPLYDVSGRSIVTEHELEKLSGYRDSAPVRIGNAAESQLQLDVFGQLLDLAWAAASYGQELDPEYWHLLRAVVERVSDLWMEPDHGFWEERGDPQQFASSKVMCWVAVDRALRLWNRYGREDAPLARWARLARDIRATVQERGYDSERGIFVRTLDGRGLDCSTLLYGISGFVDAGDPRMTRTARAIEQSLSTPNGLLHRHSEAVGKEGGFLCCSFWLVEHYARAGALEDARRVYDATMAVANDVGLLAEMADGETGELLGNFPQGLSHYAQISAELALLGRPVDDV